jgi:ABC-type uncharacterized transport system involved in gliding motility auxiliary subunit
MNASLSYILSDGCGLVGVVTLLAARALMQFPSASSERLMLAPSRSLAPLLEVMVARSEPAKSIRDIFPWVTSVVKPAVRGLCSTNTCEGGREGGKEGEGGEEPCHIRNKIPVPA